MNLNTKGKNCTLVGAPCPGEGIHEGGCPFWLEGVPLQFQEDGKLPEDIWAKGCSILLLIPLLRGVSQTAGQAAVSVQETRIDIAEGFIHLLAGLPQEADQVLPLEDSPQDEAVLLLPAPASDQTPQHDQE